MGHPSLGCWQDLGLRAAPPPRQPAPQSPRPRATTAAVDSTPEFAWEPEPSKLPEASRSAPLHQWVATWCAPRGGGGGGRGRTTLPATGPGEPLGTALAGLWGEG